MNDSSGWARRLVLAGLAVGALAVMLAGSPSPEASAQGAPTDTPAATATPPFQWIVPDTRDSRNRIHVDPFEKRFRVDYVDENNRLVQGTPIAVPRMVKTNKLVTFKYYDANRRCETATPNPSGNGPAVAPTPGRCPVSVWATLDRQRRQVRATIFRRTTRGHYVSNVINRATPLPLPQAPEPAVAISNFQVQPKRKIIRATDQLSFQNNNTLSCTIQFNSVRPPGQLPAADPTDFDLGVISPGQVARGFPRLVPTPTPTLSPDGTPEPRPDIWRPGEHVYTGSCGSIRLSGSIVVPD